MSWSSLSVNLRGGSLITCFANRCRLYRVSTWCGSWRISARNNAVYSCRIRRRCSAWRIAGSGLCAWSWCACILARYALVMALRVSAIRLVVSTLTAMGPSGDFAVLPWMTKCWKHAYMVVGTGSVSPSSETRRRVTAHRGWTAGQSKSSCCWVH